MNWYLVVSILMIIFSGITVWRYKMLEDTLNDLGDYITMLAIKGGLIQFEEDSDN